MVTRVYGLFIGLNYKQNSVGISQLDGCVPDTLYMKSYIEETFPTIQTKLLLEGQATRNNILSELTNLKQEIINNNVGGQKQLVFFYYSGHGSFVFEQTEKKDEIDEKDEVIVPYDGQFITDDLFYSTFLSLLPETCTCVMMIDACNSGTFADLDFNYKLDISQQQLLPWVETELPVDLQKIESEKTKATVYCISASSDDEYAREGYFSRYGSFRGYFTVAIQENWLTATGSKTLYDYMRSIQLQYLGTRSQTMNLNSSTNARLLSSMTLETLFGHLVPQVQIKYPSTWEYLPRITFSEEQEQEEQEQGREQEQQIAFKIKNGGQVSLVIMLILTILIFSRNGR